MKLNIVLMVWVLLTSAAQAAQLELGSAPPGERLEPDLVSWVWIQSPEPWQIRFTSSEPNLYWSLGQDWQQNSWWSGPATGPSGRSFPLKLAYEVPWRQSGRKEIPLQVELACPVPALLALELNEQLLLQPLWGDNFAVQTGAGTQTLPAGDWTVLPRAEVQSVSWQGVAIFSSEEPLVQIAADADQSPAISWPVSHFVAECGDSLPVQFTVIRPLPGNKLTITSSASLELQTEWSINGEVQQMAQGAPQITLSLPADFKLYPLEIRGQAWVGFPEGSTPSVTVSWPTGTSVLTGIIQRGFFHTEGQVEIQLLTEDGKPAAYSRIVLQDGTTWHASASGRITATLPAGRHLLYCPDGSEFRTVQVTPGSWQCLRWVLAEVQPSPQPYGFWSWRYDRGFTVDWYLHDRRPGRELQASTRQLILQRRTDHGRWQLALGAEQVHLSLGPRRTYAQWHWGQWQWLEDGSQWSGSWQGASYRANVTWAGDELDPPQLFLEMAEGGPRFFVSPQQWSISQVTSQATWGIQQNRDSAPRWWVRFPQLYNGQLSYQAQQWRLQATLGDDYYIRWVSKPVARFLELEHRTKPQLLYRWEPIPHSRHLLRWQQAWQWRQLEVGFSTAAILQDKFTIGEHQVNLRWEASARDTVNLNIVWQREPRRLNWDWQLDWTIEPLANLFVNLGVNRQEGLSLRIGWGIPVGSQR